MVEREDAVSAVVERFVDLIDDGCNRAAVGLFADIVDSMFIPLGLIKDVIDQPSEITDVSLPAFHATEAAAKRIWAVAENLAGDCEDSDSNEFLVMESMRHVVRSTIACGCVPFWGFRDPTTTEFEEPSELLLEHREMWTGVFVNLLGGGLVGQRKLEAILKQ